MTEHERCAMVHSKAMNHSNMSRRAFLQASVGAAAGLAAQRLLSGQPVAARPAATQSSSSSQPASGPARSGPNILFINTDQLRPDFLGCYGFAAKTSPNIDRLAGQGMVFRNTFTQSPICVPARYSLTTGQYPTDHGAHTNNHHPYPTVGSLVESFNAAGFHTVAIGKLHHNPPDEKFGFNEVFLHDGTFRDRRQFSVYSQWLVKEGVNEDDLAYAADVDDTSEKRRLKDKLHWGRCRLDDKHCESTFLASFAEDYIARYDKGKPVFFYLSFLAPHSPYCPPAPYDTMFKPADMPITPRETPAQLAAKHSSTAAISQKVYGEGGIPEQTMREVRAQYAGLVAHLDRCIGQAIDAFRKKFGDDCLIVFTSDHGDLLGEHHRCEKHQVYESAVRIPHIVCWPDRVKAGATTDAMTEQIDMFPTVLGLVGAKWPAGRTAGRDRSAGILAGDVKGEEFVFSENHDIPQAAYTAMARSRTQKLVLYLGGKEGMTPAYEFYDLAADPHELDNVVNKPEHAASVARHKDALLGWFIRTEQYIPPAKAAKQKTES